MVVALITLIPSLFLLPRHPPRLFFFFVANEKKKKKSLHTTPRELVDRTRAVVSRPALEATPPRLERDERSWRRRPRRRRRWWMTSGKRAPTATWRSFETSWSGGGVTSILLLPLPSLSILLPFNPLYLLNFKTAFTEVVTHTRGGCCARGQTLVVRERGLKWTRGLAAGARLAGRIPARCASERRKKNVCKARRHGKDSASRRKIHNW